MAAPHARRKGESAREFEAARVYFELGSERSLAKTAEKIGKSIPLLKKWSTKQDWAGRARRFDRVKDSGRRAELAKLNAADAQEQAEIDKKRRRRAGLLADRILDQVEGCFKFPLAEVTHDGADCMTPEGKMVKQITIVKPVRWTLWGATRMVREALIIGDLTQRTANGEKGARRDERFDIEDWTPDEEDEVE